MSRPYLLLTLLLAQSALPQRNFEPTASVAALPAPAKRWALLIGIDDYDDPQITRLQGAANDARALKSTLTKYAGFPDDQVIVLATGEPAERRPTRSNILFRLSNIASVVPKDGLLLVAFAGHGMERANRAFLLPADARLSDDADFLEDVSVSVNRMRNRIRTAAIQQVLVLLDACRNDPGGRADAPNLLTESYLRGFRFDVRNREVTAFATLYATKVGDRAFESTEKRRGYFSWMLEEALTGRAANDRGEVTLSSVVRYLQDRVPKQVAIDLGSGKRQLPFAEIGGYRADDLVLSVISPGPQVARVREPAMTPDAEAWTIIRNSTNPQDFEQFLRDFPQSPYAGAARFKLAAVRTPDLKPPLVVTPTPGVALKPGQTKINSKDGLTYVWIPPGKFQMGCSPGDNECFENEKPLRLSHISKGFWLSQTEVTQAAWNRVMGGSNPSEFNGDDFPIERVDWNQAKSYCATIGGRLPTEAEWEYAARAGSTNARYGELDEIAWHGINSGSRTHPVAQKQPNAWGLYDMLGNVSEWTANGGSDSKILRGGSWFNVPKILRASFRFSYPPSTRDNALGVRCAGD